MNGIEKITAKLSADCDAELEALRLETEKQCEGVRAEGDKAAQAEYWRLIKAGTADCEARTSQIARTAQMEARKSVLALKQELVAAAFAKAEEKLLSMPEADYVAFLARKAAEASMSGSETLYFGEKDLPAVGSKVTEAANALLTGAGKTGALKLGKEARSISGGFILGQGDIEVNCSAHLLTEQLRSALASEVAGVLFGE